MLGAANGGPQEMKFEKLGFWGMALKGLGIPAVLGDCQILQCALRVQRKSHLCFASPTPYSWGWGMVAALLCTLADGSRSSREEGQCFGGGVCFQPAGCQETGLVSTFSEDFQDA